MPDSKPLGLMSRIGTEEERTSSVRHAAKYPTPYARATMRGEGYKVHFLTLSKFGDGFGRSSC